MSAERGPAVDLAATIDMATAVDALRQSIAIDENWIAELKAYGETTPADLDDLFRAIEARISFNEHCIEKLMETAA